MRGLKDRFIEELQGGKLAWFLQEIKENPALFLSIEKNFVNIYYRGTVLLSIKMGGGFTFGIEEKYFISDAMKEEFAVFNRDKKAVGVYQRKFPVLVQATDESYATVHPVSQEPLQAIAQSNPYIIALDYEVAEGLTVDMLGIYNGKLVALQHNLGQSVGRVAPVYEALCKLWDSPTGKEELLGSAKAIAENLQTLGLLEAPLTLSEETLDFVALLSDCDGTVPSGSVPLTVMNVALTDTVVNLSL